MRKILSCDCASLVKNRCTICFWTMDDTPAVVQPYIEVNSMLAHAWIASTISTCLIVSTHPA
ncbi:hypothetical protein [Sphaerisporangium sp. TRM90804]|uniref:hypothetical protein n=1 Tax=Sphaerisporangium sp. TRM90804 TaxID=3031113 RepID=UPI00244AD9BE|nr:hypothetical protein [Sphaerisporangium sp. TRM90804]MDH2425074.1 hypothetical protein [Sphaerisporangium sp. TRM90804]